jgi:dihydrodipicolinate synthase/N-acetylneuraminate lyase
MDRLAYREKISGNFIALPTPFNADFSLDLLALRRLVRRLIKAGYRTGNGILLVGGAGGEFHTLRTSERKQIAEVVLEEAGGLIPVVVGAQSTSGLVMLELARFAERIRADGIQVSPPYYEPVSPDGVFELYKSISDAADIPMVVYNTWWTGTNADLSYEQTARLLEIANVGALKWSASRPSDYESVLRDFSSRIPIIDNHICEVFSHMLGATSFTSHPPLAWPEWGLNLWECLKQQRYVEATEMLKQFRIPYYHLFFKAYAYSASESVFDKAILEMIGEPVGLARPPARPLTPELREQTRRMLLEVGVPGVLQETR